MIDASDDFVLHSYRYYGQQLPRHGHDANLVTGLYQKAQTEALKRGLIRLNPKTNTYEEVVR